MREFRCFSWWWVVCVEGLGNEACLMECSGVGGCREKEGD
jgi:hypothetical protein